MKRYYIVTSSLFKNGEIRIKSTFIDIENFITSLHNFGFDVDYSTDNNQKDE